MSSEYPGGSSAAQAEEFAHEDALLDAFVADDDDAGYGDDAGYEDEVGYGAGAHGVGSRQPTRSETRRRAKRLTHERHRRTVVTSLTLVLIAALLVGGWFFGRPLIVDAFGAGDYDGSGSGQALVQVHQGDGASSIGETLQKAGVVKTSRAFVLAAASDQRSKTIQPGYYQLRHQMKATIALNLLLDPNSRVSTTATIPEGSTKMVVFAKVAAALKVSEADVSAAAKPAALGLPPAYSSGGELTSVEGFLFPDTYTFDPGTTPSDALATMTAEFVATDRNLNFSAAAKAIGLTPYQALIVASMIEGEAKYDADRPKVARVILNRLAANQQLGIDATSIYGALLAGRDPKQLTYQENDPYNTRNRTGLPPTPIGNPGAASLKAAVNPAAGDWTHYVNGDAQGHLAFTDEAGFEAARLACVQNNWGCD